MKKQRSLLEVVELIKDNSIIMVGGFMGWGSPHKIIDAMVAKNIKGLIIICNDAGTTEYGIGKLILNGQVKKLITSHIGLNPVAGQKMVNNEVEVELCPQGTLAERIRSGGAGLGGVLTPTGIGTIVADGKRVIEVQGKKYLLEEPLKADFAILAGHQVDEFGNIFYKGSNRNFNPVMATAAETVIVEAESIVKIGCIEKEVIHTPGIYVDYIVNGGRQHESY